MEGRVEAASRFICAGADTGGRKDWISIVLRVLGFFMARRERELPRHVVVAVTDDRVHLFAARWRRMGRELRSWHRGSVRASADRAPGEWQVWLQPPGDAHGFELRSSRGRAADAVVAALGAS